MNIDDFINILKNVPKTVQIDFTGFSEPFFNKDSYEMMRYSMINGYRTVLYTTLKGLDEKYLHLLSGLRFTDLVYHIYPGIDLIKFEEKKQLFTKYVHEPSRIAIFNPEHGEVNTHVWSRGGINWDVDPKKGKFDCVFAGKLFDHNVVLPNGDVYLCCQDYGLKHKIGNLYETHYDNLDRQSIIELSNQEDSDVICRKCEIFRNI
jgi:radical SAM protein with 4Fe4S-binding SPASM domain